MSFFYEIRSPDNIVLKRDGGYPDREAATVAAREDAKKLKLSKHLGVPMVGKILVGQSVEHAGCASLRTFGWPFLRVRRD